MSSDRRIHRQPIARASTARLEQDILAARLASAVQQARSEGRTTHALLAIDLDGFTGVRASFGADAAERLLVEVGDRLRECLSVNDRIATMDSDAFQVLVACDSGAGAAWRVAELMLHVLTARYALEGRAVALAACIGIALVRSDHVAPADVTRDAREAMHRAKSSGSARCALFDVRMREASRMQLMLHAELRDAIDRSEFRMYYQPIVCCRSGALVTLEALIRWQHPVRGVLHPAEFLEALSRTGLMAEVGNWVLAEVVRQSVEWSARAGLSVAIAINVSPRELADPLFVRHVLSVVRTAGASPASIAFELTEDIELGDGELPLRALRQLRAAGFKVRIDDFGTGYSSLSYLQRLPIDGIKIDRAFLHRIDHDERQRHIVAAIVRLAHVLDLDVVAEGVERREQLDTLAALGCDHAQGYFLVPPLPADQMSAWLTASG